MGPKAKKRKPRSLAGGRGFFAPTRQNGPTASVDGIGIAMTSRGGPRPPIGRGWGPARSSCGGGFAGVLAVARCSGSVVIATGATGTAASDAGKKKRQQQTRDANQKHQQSEEGRLDHRDHQRAYREKCRLRVTDQPSRSHRSGQYRRNGAFPCQGRPGKRLRGGSICRDCQI